MINYTYYITKFGYLYPYKYFYSSLFTHRIENIGCFTFLKKVCCLLFYSSVAQLVEQLTVNQLVAGSSPARGANICLAYFFKIMSIT